MSALPRLEGSSARWKFHGARRYGISHDIPTPEGRLEILVNVSDGRRDPSVRLHALHRGDGPNTTNKIDYSLILDGWEGHDA